MKLEGVQQYVADRIAAVPELAAFGAAIQFSPLLDEVALKTQISDALRTIGVCIEISSEEASRTSDVATNRGVVADASFTVYVAESPKVAHTPSGKLLRKSVISAVTSFLTPHDTRAEFSHSDTFKSEHGYVLHELAFTIRVTIP